VIATGDHVPVKVVIADDSPAYLEALGRLVDATPGFEVVGEAASGAESVRCVLRTGAELVLLDVRMPAGGGYAAARSIAAACPETVVVLVSASGDEDLPRRALEAGAVAGVDKAALTRALLTSLWRTHAPPG
jgi:DNA-binding NarL/FixJ family response regulator